MTPDNTIIAIIEQCSKKSILKKAVFSKPADNDVLRMVATVKLIGKKQVLQAEYFMRDNKAIHKNTELGDDLAELLAKTGHPHRDSIRFMATVLRYVVFPPPFAPVRKQNPQSSSNVISLGTIFSVFL